MKKTAIIVLLAVAAITATANAKLITIGLTAEVNDVADYDGLLGDIVQVGDIITGTYTYDTSMTPASSSSTGAHYVFNSSDAGVILEINDLTFQTDSTNVDFQMGVVDEVGDLAWDQLWFRSHNNLPMAEEIGIGISMNLTDHIGNANNGTTLPTVPPVLQNFDYNNLRIEGLIPATDISSKQHFVINSEVTSVWLIPEPGTLVLLAIGGAMLRRRIS